MRLVCVCISSVRPSVATTKFVSGLRSAAARWCPGDASFLGTLFFLATSIFFVGLDLGFDEGVRGVIPPRGLTGLQALAGIGVVVSSLYYLYAWQGVAPADAPSTTALAAEYVNVFASLLYVGASWAGFAIGTPAAATAVYILQFASNALYFADALLYSRAWWADIRAAGPRPHRGCDLRDANFCGNVTNVLAAAIYVVAGTVPFILAAGTTELGGGRLVISNPSVRYATEAGDFLYLASALADLAGYFQDAADAAADAATPDAAAGEDAADADGPPFDVLQPLREAPARTWHALVASVAAWLALLRPVRVSSRSPATPAPKTRPAAAPATAAASGPTVVANPLAAALERASASA